MNKTKILILVTVFIDVAGLGIIIPILPFYVEHFSSSAILITSLYAIYAVFSFFSAPVIGAVSDKIGRKTMLIMSIFSTSIGWVVFALAPSIPFLFLGRIIDGSAAGNLPIAQAYLTDIAKDDHERTVNLGLIGAVFGIAFIIGPFIGAALGTISITFPFWFVGALALVNGILAIFFLPETHETKDRHKKVSINPFVPIARAIKDKLVRLNYLAWFLYGIAFAMFISVFALYTQAVYGYGQFATGLFFAGTGVLIALNQVFLLKNFWLRYFKEPRLELVMLIVFAAGFLVLAIPMFIWFIIGLIAVTFGQSVLRAVMTSQIASKSDQNARGEILGITSSIMSLSMAVGPFIAGALFGYQASLPFIISALLCMLGFAVLMRAKPKPKPSLV